MSRFRVLLTDRAWPDAEIERRVLAEVDAELIEAPRGATAERLIDLAADVDAIGTCWAKIPPEALRNAPRCRIVARFGIGLDNIPVETATELGIVVTNVPDYCVSEVADHTIGLLLAAARHIAFFHLRTKQGEYDLLAADTPSRLSHCRLGLIGFGRIGRAVFERARALGMDVVAHSRSGDPRGTDCPMIGLRALLETSRFVSLHVPLTDQTRRMIGREQLSWMRPDAWLINTSRGALVDTDALEEAVIGGAIGGAALDVHDPEPPDLSRPLYRAENVIATPHSAFTSREALEELRHRAARQIADALSGRVPENVVNPSVIPRWRR
ncbi:MAG: C-terminal binding protein [Planctomycetota bacterium]|nr:MAG: C-terminal binding protein [Planctomycetota bacterium]